MGTEATMQQNKASNVLSYSWVCPAWLTVQIHKHWTNGPELPADNLQAVTGEA